VQREIEAAGVTTVSLSMIPDFTQAAGAPRTAGIAFPVGRPLGQPHDATTQREILRAALGVLETAEEPGSVTYLPFTWPESPKVARRVKATEAPPIAKLIMKKPWMYLKLVSGDIPAGT
jgi:hypothetical protein